jgi:predicted transcriptional regulator
MVDIRESILDRMREFGWTINHVSVLVRDRIPRRTVYTYLTGQVDARTEVASALMEVLGLTIAVTSKQMVKRARRPRKERGA